MDLCDTTFTSMCCLDSIETGRVGKGESSDQSFGTSDLKFNIFTCNTYEYKILPNSQKPVEVAEIRNYCSECGFRIRKQNWKFCPSCGDTLN